MEPNADFTNSNVIDEVVVAIICEKMSAEKSEVLEVLKSGSENDPLRIAYNLVLDSNRMKALAKGRTGSGEGGARGSISNETAEDGSEMHGGTDENGNRRAPEFTMGNMENLPTMGMMNAPKASSNNTDAEAKGQPTSGLSSSAVHGGSPDSDGQSTKTDAENTAQMEYYQKRRSRWHLGE